MRLALLIALTLCLGACATVHEGQVGQVTSGEEVNGMVISASESGDPRQNPFSVFTVTIENKSDDWLRIESIEMDVQPAQAEKISVVLGQDLSDWAEASADKAKLEQYNQSLLKTGLYSIGSIAALVGASTGNGGAVAAGAGVVVGTAAVDITQRIIQTRNGAIRAASIPEKHLYRPFSVPGKLFVRKWLLVNKPANEQLAVLGLQIKTVDGRVSHINVPICRGSNQCRLN